MGRVLASSDWHGMGKVANKVFDWLQPDDVLYFLGDAIDRGPDGIEIFDKLIKRPNTYFICGNHEEMMSNGINYLVADDPRSYERAFDHWMLNGGVKTEKAFDTMSADELFSYKKKIHSMPTELIYESPKGHNVILEHAGYTPGVENIKHDPRWDRSHFSEHWIGAQDLYLVHGHTPVHFLEFDYGYNGQKPLTKERAELRREWQYSCAYDTDFNWTPYIIRYCDGHKFNIDMGTAFTNRIALLDLDTFEEFYFNGEN